MQNLYKNWLLVSKINDESGQLQTSSGKSEKLKFDGLLLSKKYIPSAKTYVQRIYLTLLSTICVKLPEIPYFIFETISHFLRHNSSVFFSSKITFFRQKYRLLRYQTAKCKSSDFPLLVLKLTKFLMSFFQTKSQFFFKVWNTLQCHKR